MKKSSTDKRMCCCCEKLEKLKPYKKEIMIAVVAFICGFLFKAWTTSPTTVCNAALVDVQRLIDSSADVQQLQQEFYGKQEDLQKWVKEAQDKIQKYKEGKARDKLVEEFEQEFAQKQQAMQQEYAQKLNAIDKKVTKLIKKEAKSEGYGIVLAKNSVLSGGTDITEDIISLVK